MNKKFKDLTEEDNIETISSILKDELNSNAKEYKEMMSDGIIDEEELKRIITTMQDLEFKARTLKEKMTGEKEKTIMDEIINIINNEQVNMINIKNNPVQEETEKTEKTQMEL